MVRIRHLIELNFHRRIAIYSDVLFYIYLLKRCEAKVKVDVELSL